VSLILDALRRAQRERALDAPQVLATEEALPPPAEKRTPWLPLLLLALLLVCALLLVVVLGREPRPAAVPLADSASADVAPASAALAPPPAVRAASAERNAEIAALYREQRDTAAADSATGRGGEPIAGLEADTQAQTVSAVEPEPAAGDAAEAARDDAAAAAAAPERQSQAQGLPGDARVSAPIDVETVVAMARDALGEEALAEHPVPLLDTLSKQQKDRVPSLIYLQHDYRAEGGSQVLINRTVCTEGDRVDGVRVEEILPDSVVLSYGQTRFRLRALNSWVNL